MSSFKAQEIRPRARGLLAPCSIDSETNDQGQPSARTEPWESWSSLHDARAPAGWASNLRVCPPGARSCSPLLCRWPLLHGIAADALLSGNSLQGPSQQGTALAPLQLWLLHVAFRKLKVGERWGPNLGAN